MRRKILPIASISGSLIRMTIACQFHQNFYQAVVPQGVLNFWCLYTVHDNCPFPSQLWPDYCSLNVIFSPFLCSKTSSTHASCNLTILHQLARVDYVPLLPTTVHTLKDNMLIVMLTVLTLRDAV